jgi:hypothetical protein
MQSLSVFDSADKKILPDTLNHRLWWAVAKQTQNVLKTKVGFSTAENNKPIFTDTRIRPY